MPGHQQGEHRQKRQAEAGGDHGMAGGEAAGHVVRSTHENGCKLDSCAGRKRRAQDLQVSGETLFTEGSFGKPFRINDL